ncbi:MAG: ABC transporter ATP-binding protein [Desulfobacteraceae bacterium]|nr:ABC transporter ATP-binding protein [Desulfobacteraceae bacterium]
MKTPLIKIENLNHSFSDGTCGIRDICLCIDPEEFIILAGRNGSGKTTLIRHFNGLLHPSSGKITLNGNSIFKDINLARKKIGMIFQDADTQIVGDTVFDEVAFGLENLKIERQYITKKVMQVLKQLHLDHLKDRSPATLSGGEKRKLAIAGILVMEPDIILFDEPFSNLDYPGTLSILEILIDLHESGRTIIVAAHNMEAIIAHATRLIIMEDGRIKKDGPPKDLVKTLERFGIKEPCSSRLGFGIQPWQN